MKTTVTTSTRSVDLSYIVEQLGNRHRLTVHITRLVDIDRFFSLLFIRHKTVLLQRKDTSASVSVVYKTNEKKVVF